jgi:hypothetical protein
MSQDPNDVQSLRQFSIYTLYKISVSLSYVTGREEGKIESAMGSKIFYVLLLPLPHILQLAEHHCVYL